MIIIAVSVVSLFKRIGDKMITADEAKCITNTAKNVYGRIIYEAAKNCNNTAYTFLQTDIPRTKLSDHEYYDILVEHTQFLENLGYKVKSDRVEVDNTYYLKLTISWE